MCSKLRELDELVEQFATSIGFKDVDSLISAGEMIEQFQKENQPQINSDRPTLPNPIEYEGSNTVNVVERKSIRKSRKSVCVIQQIFSSSDEDSCGDESFHGSSDEENDNENEVCIKERFNDYRHVSDTSTETESDLSEDDVDEFKGCDIEEALSNNEESLNISNNDCGNYLKKKKIWKKQISESTDDEKNISVSANVVYLDDVDESKSCDLEETLPNNEVSLNLSNSDSGNNLNKKTIWKKQISESTDDEKNISLLSNDDVDESKSCNLEETLSNNEESLNISKNHSGNNLKKKKVLKKQISESTDDEKNISVSANDDVDESKSCDSEEALSNNEVSLNFSNNDCGNNLKKKKIWKKQISESTDDEKNISVSENDHIDESKSCDSEEALPNNEVSFNNSGKNLKKKKVWKKQISESTDDEKNISLLANDDVDESKSCHLEETLSDNEELLNLSNNLISGNNLKKKKVLKKHISESTDDEKNISVSANVAEVTQNSMHDSHGHISSKPSKIDQENIIPKQNPEEQISSGCSVDNIPDNNALSGDETVDESDKSIVVLKNKLSQKYQILSSDDEQDCSFLDKPEKQTNISFNENSSVKTLLFPSEATKNVVLSEESDNEFDNYKTPKQNVFEIQSSSEDEENSLADFIVSDSENSDDEIFKTPMFTKSKNKVLSDKRFNNLVTPKSATKNIMNNFKTATLETCTPAYKREFNRIRDKVVADFFELFNRTIFDNKLDANMSITWNKRMTKTAGFCVYQIDKDWRLCKIELSDKVLDCVERLRDTLIHELCHAATWVIDGKKDNHGRFWQHWAKKANRIHSDLPIIKRCHQYEIHTKYKYQCTGCQTVIGRHSKSIDPIKHRCAECGGILVLLENTTSKKSTQNTPNSYAVFLKNNFASVKKSNPNFSHKDIMKIISEKFRLMKTVDKEN